MAENYLAHRTGSKQKLLLNSLQTIAKRLGLEFHSFPGEFANLIVSGRSADIVFVVEDMETDVLSVDAEHKEGALEAMISSAAFVVDVRFRL